MQFVMFPLIGHVITFAEKRNDLNGYTSQQVEPLYINLLQ